MGQTAELHLMPARHHSRHPAYSLPPPQTRLPSWFVYPVHAHLPTQTQAVEFCDDGYTKCEKQVKDEHQVAVVVNVVQKPMAFYLERHLRGWMGVEGEQAANESCLVSAECVPGWVHRRGCR